MTNKMTRRGFGSIAAAGLLSVAGRKAAQAQSIYNSPGMCNLLGNSAEAFEASLEGAVSFLSTMQDAFVAGNTVRLSPSYSDQGFGASNPAVAFTYDNAVAIQAYLARGSASDVQRATILGNGLVHAQATNFPFNDGRFGQAYYVNTADSSGAYITPAAFPFYFYSSSVGDQSWAGMALAQLYNRTGTAAFLTAALSVGNWIVTNAYNTLGAGGYGFGTTINQFNQSVPSTNGKSTEHNIDTYAFFTMLAALTHGGKSSANGMTWASLAQHAYTFVQSMFNPTGGFFWTGTAGDQITTNYYPIPEDVQTWSYLAFQNKAYGVSLDWVKTNLLTVDTPSSPFSALKGLGNLRVQGETFDTASLATSGNDPEAVWLEGTAHTAAALLLRQLPPEKDIPFYDGDLNTALGLLQNIRLAQSKLGTGQTINNKPIVTGQGIVAATGNLDTGFGYDYFPNLHIGATGWYVLALLAANPFMLGYRTSRW
jgi:hypothetical protein